MALPLQAQGLTRVKSMGRAKKMLREVGLEQQAKKYPQQLSGGMRQLTALARAFVMEPEILLLDEPTSSLDYSTTRFLQSKMLQLWDKNKKTTVCVSHDPDEAILLADRVLIFSERPAVIIKEIKIALPRPRNFAMLTSPAFLAYRQEVLLAFEYDQV